MKVIKEGRPQKGWATQTSCNGQGNGMGGCGATLLVEQGDLFHTYSHVCIETTTYTTFKCPCCGVLTDIEVPPDISVHKNQAVWLKSKEEK
jgi:hypothetical protein